MKELPKCPKCGLRVDVYRMRLGFDKNLDDIYGICCGCADCNNVTVLHCTVNTSLLVDRNEVQSFWDFEYGLAIEQWENEFLKKKGKCVSCRFEVMNYIIGCKCPNYKVFFENNMLDKESECGCDKWEGKE